MVRDAVGVRPRGELGVFAVTAARPVQAVLTSAATFAVGAAMSLLMVVASPAGLLIPAVSMAALGFLLCLARSAPGRAARTYCAA